jgi:FlaA1/EpsC-like NDP-sugar epimerase
VFILKISIKRGVLIATDGLMLVVAGIISLSLRFDGHIPDSYLQELFAGLIVALPLMLFAYLGFGLYNHLWRYASIKELLHIVISVSISSLLILVPVYRLMYPGFSRGVIVLIWVFNVILVGSTRLAMRIRRDILDARNNAMSDNDAVRTLIVGAGSAGNMLLKEFQHHNPMGYKVVGFVDDDKRKIGFKISSVTVLGTTRELPRLIGTHRIELCVIAMPSAPGRVVRNIVEQCEKTGVKLKTLPGIYELIDGKVDAASIRDVQIEDLLGRQEIKIDLQQISGYLQGQVVLVTGAGGSIGSELCRQISRFSPKLLVMLGHGENSIYSIEMEFREKYPNTNIMAVIADVRDYDRIDEVFATYRPDVVFHAAAHKHVPLMEGNAGEAIKNNVFGTKNVAVAADKYEVKRFVLISTDKAVNPSSVMGSTKRAAEIIIQLVNNGSKTKFMAVRFGNVLGSRGSVIPVFKQQIAHGGPLTVTHPEMKRYFMTIPEAVQLVIQAGAMGEGGEVFVLDMGEPIRILDMARDLIRLSGLELDKDISIKFTGVRPGEKLFEELLTAEEGTSLTKHKKIFVAKGANVYDGTLEQFTSICFEIACSDDAGNRIRDWINSLLRASQVEYEVAAANDVGLSR